MKRFLFFAVAVMLFAACSKDAINEQQGIQNIVDEAPATLTVGFEDDETRIQLNEAQKTVWTNGDLVSVFYRSDANQQWQYTGETGSRTAELTRVEAGVATEVMKRVVVVYPYSGNYYINTETYNVQATLPAVQNYLKDSYGLDGNIMISQSEYNNISLKNVCGWLKLQLTGNGEQVKSITVRGNNGEQVAGELYINSADATATLASDMGDVTEDEGENETGGAGGNLVFEDTVLTEVTLNCLDRTSPTEKGVALGAESTSFYIALPPQTFTKGITVDITATNGLVMTKSTDNEVVIERNHIKPMTAFGYNGVFKPANNEIYYTNGSTTEPTAPSIAAFGSATIQSNTYDVEKECWVITFDKEVTEIGDNAFYNCDNLTSVTIGDSVTEIGEKAFYYCNSLTSVTIGNSVTTIGKGAFAGCESLTSVTIGDSVTTIEERAFENCKSLKEFKGKFAADSGRCLIMDNTIIAYANASGTTYTIPDSVTTIGDWAFEDCTSLTSVTIPDSVTTIGKGAFYLCRSLTSVTIPDSVTTIGDETFYYCDSLTSVTIPNSVTTIGEAAFNFCYRLTSVTIPDSVTTIGGAAFSGCTSLTNMTIPDSVTTIGDYAFSFCGSLTSVTFGDSVTTIGEEAFYHCSSLTSVTIPNSVTTIGDKAFYNCEILTNVTIGDSVTTIGDYAFNNCISLKAVYCKPTTPPTGGIYMFDGNAAGRSICVPASDDDSIIKAYKEASGWSEYKDYIFDDEPKPANNEIWYTNGSTTEPTAPRQPAAFGSATIQSNSYDAEKESWVITFDKDVTEIGNSAFSNCDSLTSVNIPNSVTTIGMYAFADCEGLTSVNIPNSVTTIGAYAFQYCSSFTSVTIPDRVTTIGKNAFDSCTSLTSVTISDSVTTIGEKAFYHCRRLTSVTIPDSVTTIGYRAFYNCDSLTSVTISDSVTTIGDYAFYSCNSLTSVTIGNSVTTIGGGAFAGCRSLKEFKGKFAADGGRCLIKDNIIIAYAEASGTTYTIPDSVTTIGYRAFAVCTSLTSVTIPDSVTTIVERAFDGCDSLTSVTIPDSVTTIGDWAFTYCDSLASVTIGNSVTTIGEWAFGSCESLKTVYCKPTTPPAGGNNMFYANASDRKIYVPTGSGADYKAKQYWSDYKDYIEEDASL